MNRISLGVTLYGLWFLLVGIIITYGVWHYSESHNILHLMAASPLVFGLLYILVGIFTLIRITHYLASAVILSSLILLLLDLYVMSVLSSFGWFKNWLGLFLFIIFVVIPITAIKFFAKKEVREYCQNNFLLY